MKSDYRHSHSIPGKGISYHAAFSDNPYRSLVWEFEKDAIDDILKEYYEGAVIDHLDFACGTGRILGYCQKYAAVSVGVDVSPSMLEIAHKNAEESELYEADITQNDILLDRKFNLVTAFRFFPNAEPRLRQEAMQALLMHLSQDGYIVFNNHRNTASLRNCLKRWLKRGNIEGMSMTDVRALLSNNGLELVQTYSLCIFPASERRMLVPRFVLRFMESLLGKFPFLRKFGENLIFVSRRSSRDTGI